MRASFYSLNAAAALTSVLCERHEGEILWWMSGNIVRFDSQLVHRRRLQVADDKTFLRFERIRDEIPFTIAIIMNYTILHDKVEQWTAIFRPCAELERDKCRIWKYHVGRHRNAGRVALCADWIGERRKRNKKRWELSHISTMQKTLSHREVSYSAGSFPFYCVSSSECCTECRSLSSSTRDSMHVAIAEDSQRCHDVACSAACRPSQLHFPFQCSSSAWECCSKWHSSRRAMVARVEPAREDYMWFGRCRSHCRPVNTKAKQIMHWVWSYLNFFLSLLFYECNSLSHLTWIISRVGIE